MKKKAHLVSTLLLLLLIAGCGDDGGGNSTSDIDVDSDIDSDADGDDDNDDDNNNDNNDDNDNDDNNNNDDDNDDDDDTGADSDADTDSDIDSDSDTDSDSDSDTDTDTGTETVSVEITIAQYNVENFDLGGDADGQYGYIAQFAKDCGIDVIVVEETQSSDGDEAGFTTALEDISYPMDFHSLSSMSDNFNSIGVWSRYPLESVSEILEENTRTIYRFSIDMGDDDQIWFYGCHLKSGTDTDSQDRRKTEAGRLETYILENHDPLSESVVVLGDMNTMSDGDWLADGTIDRLTLKSDNPGNTDNDFIDVNYTELPDEYTYPSYESLLDHVILSPEAMNHYVDGSVEIPNPGGDGDYGPSDHYPVILTVEY
jgi:hypothetical protein